MTHFIRQAFWRCYPYLSYLHALFPSTCTLCQQQLTAKQFICEACQTFFILPEFTCDQCACPLSSHENSICTRCHLLLPAYDRTIAAALYTPPADNMVIRLKYHHQLHLAHTMATLLRHRIAAHPHLLPDCLCPVPLSLKRLSERGFNQSLEIAKPLARMLGIKLLPRLCLRSRHTHSQAQLSGQQRQSNLHQAFRIDRRFYTYIKGRHIGLIDDVMTTGETLHELALTLKTYGAHRVTNYVFARTTLSGTPSSPSFYASTNMTDMAL